MSLGTAQRTAGTRDVHPLVRHWVMRGLTMFIPFVGVWRELVTFTPWYRPA